MSLPARDEQVEQSGAPVICIYQPALGRGEPPVSFETMVKLISTTTTNKGLKVYWGPLETQNHPHVTSVSEAL
jgi:hypothetical protein